MYRRSICQKRSIFQPARSTFPRSTFFPILSLSLLPALENRESRTMRQDELHARGKEVNYCCSRINDRLVTLSSRAFAIRSDDASREPRSSFVETRLNESNREASRLGQRFPDLRIILGINRPSFSDKRSLSQKERKSIFLERTNRKIRVILCIFIFIYVGVTRKDVANKIKIIILLFGYSLHFVCLFGK